MKALTLTQPWATLVAIGAKTIETRCWDTAHRGEIAIHAAKGFPDDARYIVTEEPFTTALGGLWASALPMKVWKVAHAKGVRPEAKRKIAKPRAERANAAAATASLFEGGQ